MYFFSLRLLFSMRRIIERGIFWSETMAMQYRLKAKSVWFSLLWMALPVSMVCAQGVIEGPVTLDAQKLKAFEKASVGKIGLVYVHAWWCGQCMMYQGKIKRFAREHPDKVRLLIAHYGNSKAFLKTRFGIDDRGYVVRYENGKWSAPVQYPALSILPAARP